MSAALKVRLAAQDGPLASAIGQADIQTADEVRTASGGQEPSADRLDAAGTQRITSKGGNAGVRVVFHFPDAATALKDYKIATQPRGGSATLYSIPGMPNSSAADEGHVRKGDRNVMFVIGSYEYRLGFSLENGNSPTHAQFVAMAQAWYDALETIG